MKIISHLRAKAFRKFNDLTQPIQVVKTMTELVMSGEVKLVVWWISFIHEETHAPKVELLVTIEADQEELFHMARERLSTLISTDEAGFDPSQFFASSWIQVNLPHQKSLFISEDKTINSTFEVMADAQAELAYCFEISKAQVEDKLKDEAIKAMRSALWSSEFDLDQTTEEKLYVKTSVHSPTGELSRFVLDLLSRNVYLGQGLIKKHLLLSVMPLPKITDYSKSLKVERLPLIIGSRIELDKGLILGDHCTFDGQSMPFRSELNHHHAVIGSTGSGKSTSLISIAQSAIEAADRAVVVIDPHGSLVLDILKRVPFKDRHRLIYLDMGDPEHSMGLNLLDSSSFESLSYSIGEIDQMFLMTYGPEIWGPRLSDIFRNTAMLAGLSSPPKTLIDILAMAELDAPRLRGVLSTIKRPLPTSLKTYLEQIQTQRTGYGSLAEAISYFRAKFSPLTDSLYTRQILGQAKTSILFEEAFENRQVILFNLDKGRLSSRYSSLIGKLLVSKMIQETMRSSRRNPVFLMIDEFSQFTSDTFSIALSEGRKYGLSLCLATQTIAQFQNNGFEIGAHQDLLSSVLNNMGSLASFRVSHLDAKVMAPYFGEQINPYDLSQLPNYYAICRVTSEVHPQLFKTRLIPPTLDELSMNEIIDRSRRLYTVPSQDIEREIQARLRY